MSLFLVRNFSLLILSSLYFVFLPFSFLFPFLFFLFFAAQTELDRELGCVLSLTYMAQFIGIISRLSAPFLSVYPDFMLTFSMVVENLGK